jgi:hypothetical protein
MMPLSWAALGGPRVNEAPETRLQSVSVFLAPLASYKARHASRFLNHKATW